MSSGLLGAIATWPDPNYINPQTRGHGIIIASIIFGTICPIVTGLRLYTRVFITRTSGADDVMILLATIFSLSMFVCLSIASSHYGWNKHTWDIPLELLPKSQIYGLVFSVTFSLAAAFTKLSLLWFCRRILGEARKSSFKWHDIALCFSMLVIGTFLVIFFILEFTQCRSVYIFFVAVDWFSSMWRMIESRALICSSPLKAYWDIFPTYEYHCMNKYMLIFAASVANTVTDFITTFIPVSLISGLRLARRQQIACISIFALGILVSIVGCLRCYYVYRYSLVTNLDYTWVGWSNDLAAIIEIGVGLIIASAPAIRPLLNRWFPHLLKSSGKYQRTYNEEGVPGYPGKDSVPLAHLGSMPAKYNARLTTIPTV